VLDGETVLPMGERLDFEALLQRVHPADSRVRMLAETTPAHFVAFDVLALGDEAFWETPFEVRRGRLEAALTLGDRVHLTPYTDDRDMAQQWFLQFEGAGLDGVMAKPRDLPYAPDKRLMRKIKHHRTADCVVAGYRVHKSGSGVGSLLLGLYDRTGTLQHVGVIGALTAARRLELEAELAPLVTAPGSQHPWLGTVPADGDRVPGGGQSRWAAGKDLSFTPLDPDLVVEVAYEHMEGTRFRHTAQIRHFRPDRDPRSCTYEQLDEPVSYDLAKVFAGRP
jgi:ATP-dependent DNA ligase